MQFAAGHYDNVCRGDCSEERQDACEDRLVNDDHESGGAERADHQAEDRQGQVGVSALRAGGARGKPAVGVMVVLLGVGKSPQPDS
jgi:hypothetical protein